jgi:hypothetical protein
MGCECLFLTQSELAGRVAKKVSAAAGFKNRGAKKRDDLYFLNKTDMPSILIEVCFCDSKRDVELYRAHFGAICGAICDAIAEVKPDEIPTGLNELLTIGEVTIYEKDSGQYIRFISNLDVCNDGCGPSHGDPYHKSMTAYYSGGCTGDKYLNADCDKYIVIPPQIRQMVAPVVMGCRARVTNLRTGDLCEGMIGEIGPDDKTGETAYIVAKTINHAVTYNSGDLKLNYLYEFWPGVVAVVDGFEYKLQPA